MGRTSLSPWGSCATAHSGNPAMALGGQGAQCSPCWPSCWTGGVQVMWDQLGFLFHDMPDTGNPQELLSQPRQATRGSTGT